MQIILQEDIEKLGHRGDVVTVKPGYARNFLLPRKLAVEANAGNLKAIERIRTSLAKKTATELDAAQKQAALLNGISLKFTRKTGENDQMFGSVTTADIAEALAAQSFKIDKRQVQIAEPIKALGEYPVTIKVFRDVTAQVTVHVTKEEESRRASQFEFPRRGTACRALFFVRTLECHAQFLQQRNTPRPFFSRQNIFENVFNISELMHSPEHKISLTSTSLRRTMRSPSSTHRELFEPSLVSRSEKYIH